MNQDQKSIHDRKKNIAKNTLFLYFRMLLIMGVNLYTVRVVLNALGETDYGIYNVVGGIVIMFSFLSGTMASASQRFFAFELGRKDYVKLKQTFSLTLLSYIGIAVLIILLAETLGLWFLNTKMNIPSDRMYAANWVYQFSVLSFVMTILSIPYNAVIIAHERMKVYAYVSIVDTLLKLLIVFLLVLFSFDKLKLYAILTFVATVLVTTIYRIYCKRKFEETSYRFYWNKYQFKELMSYAGWNMLGSVSVSLKEQGVNILLNIFFNPIINASRGIAFQINTAILQFTNNFYSAVRPQIIKSYSIGEFDYMKKLIFKSSKFSFFLTMFLIIPLLLETEFILLLWLDTLPNKTLLFVRLVLINSLIDVMNTAFVTAIQATGRIKVYQLVVSVILLLNLPIAYLFLSIGYPPEITMIISVFLSMVCYGPRLYICKKTVSISLQELFLNVFSKVILVFFVSFTISIGIYLSMEASIMRLLSVCILGSICTLIVIYNLGLTKSEKIFIISTIKKGILRFTNKTDDYK